MELSELAPIGFAIIPERMLGAVRTFHHYGRLFLRVGREVRLGSCAELLRKNRSLLLCKGSLRRRDVAFFALLRYVAVLVSQMLTVVHPGVLPHSLRSECRLRLVRIHAGVRQVGIVFPLGSEFVALFRVSEDVVNSAKDVIHWQGDVASIAPRVVQERVAL